MFFKFALVAFLAVCSLQALDAKHIASSRDLNQVIQEIKEVLQKVKKVVDDFMTNLTQDIAGLQSKINDIIKQIDVPSIIADIQNKINDILHGSGVDPIKAKDCLDKEKAALELLAKDIQDGVTVCVKKADDVMRGLKDLVLDVEDKGEKLIASAEKKVLDCIHNNHIPTEAIKCVQNEFEAIKTEVDTFIAELDKAVNSAHELVQKAENDLATCATDLQAKIKTEADGIVAEFEACLKDLPPVRQPRNVIDDVISKIKEVMQQIEQAITDIENKIPQMLDDLKKRIQEILNNLDEQKILDAIKNMLDKILETVGADPAVVEKCTTQAEESAEKLVKDTQAGLTVCVQQVDDATRPLKDNAAKILEKAKGVIEDINNRITVCQQEGIIAALKCLKDLVQPVTEEVKALVAEIVEFTTDAQKIVDQASQQLELCAFGVYEKLVDGERTIVEDFKNCLANPTFYYM